MTVLSLENFRELFPPELLGSTQLLFPDDPKQQWTPRYAYALEESLLYSLDFETTRELVRKELTNIKQQELQRYLCSVIPSLENKIQSQRKRIISLFRPQTFPIPGIKLISEGEPCKRIYLITKGECVMVSQKIPISVNESSEGRKNRMNHPLVNKNGYFSRTLNSF